MSPEAIETPEGMRRLKVGRSSDVWSLGCILYQMVYGHPPFHHLSVIQKMRAIPDVNHEIKFPAFSYRGLTKMINGSANGSGGSGEGEEGVEKGDSGGSGGTGGGGGETDPDKTARPVSRQAERLKGTRVRRDVIECIKACLVRDPKQRALIPELLDQDWLTMSESACLSLLDTRIHTLVFLSLWI